MLSACTVITQAFRTLVLPSLSHSQNLGTVLRLFLFYFIFFGCICGMWKFLGQISNLSHSSDNARLTARPLGSSYSYFFLKTLLEEISDRFKKIFAKHISDKKKRLALKIQQDNLISEKWAEDLNKHFTKKIQRSDTSIKRCSTSLIIGGIAN